MAVYNLKRVHDIAVPQVDVNLSSDSTPKLSELSLIMVDLG